MKTVAIVGAGATGLCAGRHFASDLNFQVTLFEQANNIGGVWWYDGRLERNTFSDLKNSESDIGEEFCTSSMYRNLTTNIPKEVMAFPDFPFTSSIPNSYITHGEVMTYLKAYTEYFGVTKLIRFRTEVIKVEPILENPEPGLIQWSLTSKNLDTQEEKTETFDFMIICNGHFTIPRVPELENMSYFKGFTLHSRYYKNPEPFTGKIVAVLGSGWSGKDIALDVASVAKKVYICHRKDRFQTKLLDNMEERMGIVSVSKETGDLVLSDGSSITAEVILFCTGYYYDMPFLSKKCKVDLECGGRVVAPLYRHVLHQIYPSLAFIGLPSFVCPFLCFDNQVKFTLAVYSGKVELPPREVMLQGVQDDLDEKTEKGLRPDQFHCFKGCQWTYYDKLTKEGKFDFPLYTMKLYEFVLQDRIVDYIRYKRHNFRVTEDKKDFIYWEGNEIL